MRRSEVGGRCRCRQRSRTCRKAQPSTARTHNFAGPSTSGLRRFRCADGTEGRRRRTAPADTTSGPKHGSYLCPAVVQKQTAHFLTYHEVVQDWKFVAQVLDHIFLWLFLIVSVTGYVLIFTPALKMWLHSHH
ncbi:Neuronal acetylcholine receptor subunit beta-3 [Manis javanica]|nr:Neuronal acetylcholine receptor subunit beta-3 [Manis javanica]